MYKEIGEIEVKDTYYFDEICNALRAHGFEVALIHEGIGYSKVRILKETKNEME